MERYGSLVHGPTILAKFLEAPSPPNSHGIAWQYDSQSDRHSRVGCWGVAFDLLATSALFRKHAADGKVVVGVNHTMRDYGTGRKKKLDLVIARPAAGIDPDPETFRGLASKSGIMLTPDQNELLESLPDIAVADVGSAVLIALEAKAVMTKHQGALPRFYDELNSSHLAVHGASSNALAIAYIQINSALQFASSPSNRFTWDDQHPPKMNKHVQPRAVESVLSKVAELPRRTGTVGNGFDGIGVTVLEIENLGGPVTVVEGSPAPKSTDAFNYDNMIARMAHEYDSRFHTI